MLTISPQATDAIRGILESEGVPDGAVLRISPQPDAGLAVTVVESPEAADQVVEADEGVEVSVEPSAAEMLDDKELDARVEEGQVTFTIAEQE